MVDENTANSSDPTKEPAATTPEPESGSAAPIADGSTAPSAEPPAAGAPAKALTPGQRLAAKQAIKATQKRAFKDDLRKQEEEERQKEQEEADRILGRAPVEPVLPQNVEKAASTFTHFLQDNRARILIAVGGLIVAGGIFIGVSHFMGKGSREQADQLRVALEQASAGIDKDDADGKTDDGKPLFKSEAERAEKSAAAFAAAAKIDADSAGGVWAQLGQAAMDLAAGKLDQARATFQKLASSATKDPAQQARAIEGAAIALEAQGKVDEAVKLYEQLKGIEGEKMLGEYHLARLRLSKGDREGAKNALKAIYDELNAPKPESPPSPYLRSEVELRLAELDSSLVQGSSMQAPQQFSDEQLQRLIQQLQKGKAPGTEGE